MIKSGRLDESTYDGDAVNWNKLSVGDGDRVADEYRPNDIIKVMV